MGSVQTFSGGFFWFGVGLRGGGYVGGSSLGGTCHGGTEIQWKGHGIF